MARSTALRLAAYLRSYRELAEGIAGIGFIAAGTVPRRYTRCGKTQITITSAGISIPSLCNTLHDAQHHKIVGRDNGFRS